MPGGKRNAGRPAEMESGERFTFRLPLAIKRRIQYDARRWNLSMGMIIRRALEKHYDRTPQKIRRRKKLDYQTRKRAEMKAAEKDLIAR